MDAYAFSSWPTELTALLDWRGLPLDMASLAALAAGLGWASGLRLYALVFVLGALGRFGGVQLPGGLEVLTHPLLLGVSGVMLLAEFFADKLPWFDSMWDAVHTFIRIPAGAALAAAAMGDQSGAMQVAAALAGGGHALRQGGGARGDQHLTRAGDQRHHLARRGRAVRRRAVDAAAGAAVVPGGAGGVRGAGGGADRDAVALLAACVPAAIASAASRVARPVMAAKTDF